MRVPQTSAISSGPEMTLRILTAVEATTRSSEGQQQVQQQHSSTTSCPKARISNFLSSTSVSQQIEMLKVSQTVMARRFTIHSMKSGCIRNS